MRSSKLTSEQRGQIINPLFMAQFQSVDAAVAYFGISRQMLHRIRSDANQPPLGGLIRAARRAARRHKVDQLPHLSSYAITQATGIEASSVRRIRIAQRSLVADFVVG